mmetsp:Transcript_29502/g.38002  ORF Transcript_29502/g.38002 Transcript_29502/m.38002 type:complete len:84 (+) Transcript_29502:1669-1920(+)
MIRAPRDMQKYSAVLSKICQQGRMLTKESPTQGSNFLVLGLKEQFFTWWTKFLWRRTTPLGLDVVPEVYTRVALLSSVTCTGW